MRRCAWTRALRVPVEQNMQTVYDLYGIRPSQGRRSTATIWAPLWPPARCGSCATRWRAAAAPTVPRGPPGRHRCLGVGQMRPYTVGTDDFIARNVFAADVYKRTVLCDPLVDLSIRQAVGNPNGMTFDLYDSTSRASSATLNDLRVRAQERGDSDVDAEYFQKSLMKFVYVTSSHELDTAPACIGLETSSLPRRHLQRHAAGVLRLRRVASGGPAQPVVTLARPSPRNRRGADAAAELEDALPLAAAALAAGHLPLAAAAALWVVDASPPPPGESSSCHQRVWRAFASLQADHQHHPGFGAPDRAPRRSRPSRRLSAAQRRDIRFLRGGWRAAPHPGHCAQRPRGGHLVLGLVPR